MTDRILNGMFACNVTTRSLAGSDTGCSRQWFVLRKTNNTCRMTQRTSPDNLLPS